MARDISEDLDGLVDIISIFSTKKEILLKGSSLVGKEYMESEIRSRIDRYGLQVEFLGTDPYLLIRIRTKEAFKSKFPWTNVILFTITVLTTILTGAFWAGVDWISKPAFIFSNPLAVIIGGLPFSISLLAILVFHEFGHYFAARHHGVDVSLPYFIPAPTIIGTFGAVIKSKSPFLNKKQLLDVGAAGPLAGMVISIIVLVIGINSSTVVPAAKEFSGYYFSDSLLSKALIYLIIGPIGEGQGLLISPIFLAGWVGMLVTMFNLMPMGQLDGGHITYALFGKSQKYIAGFTIFGLVILSFYWWGWVIWVLLGLFMGLKHPPTAIDEIRLGKGRIIIGIICLFVFVACFMPIPLRY